MPTRPSSQCRHYGCTTLVSTPGYCKAHTIEAWPTSVEYDKNRPSASARGYDGKWRKARSQFLRANPLCASCLAQGVTTPAIVVDHIIPHRGDMAIFWNVLNWQPLCAHHHNVKTIKETNGALQLEGGWTE